MNYHEKKRLERAVIIEEMHDKLKALDFVEAIDDAAGAWQVESSETDIEGTPFRHILVRIRLKSGSKTVIRQRWSEVTHTIQDMSKRLGFHYEVFASQMYEAKGAQPKEMHIQGFIFL